MKKNKIRIALAQINTTVGDLQGNKDKIIAWTERALKQNCDLVIFPELAVTGYPPEDILYRSQFIKDQYNVYSEIKNNNDNIIQVFGFVNQTEKGLYNAAAINIPHHAPQIYHKIHLPNYSVFDEERYFVAGTKPFVFNVNGVKIGASICEDIWIDDGVIEAETFCEGAELILNISASPFYFKKGHERIELLQNKAKKTKSIIAYVNLVGGQDELVFDGQSFIANHNGEILAQAKSFEEDFLVYDLDFTQLRKEREKSSDFRKLKSEFINPYETIHTDDFDTEFSAPKVQINQPASDLNESEMVQVYKALKLGLKDYVHKNRFQKVVFGLSGGIDSALVAAIAADALGKENVICITMPSQYSSKGSVDDSVQLANNFGFKLLNIQISPMFDAFNSSLKEAFSGTEPDVTEENLQARIRGSLVMALSNKFGYLALATGNKSEVSVGYCTIYGDMVGGYGPLKDVYKTIVYELCHLRNQQAGYDIIPQSIIDKAPSAELRPDQTDQDSLPPYDILDDILELYIEKDNSVPEITAQGFDLEIVSKVARLVDINEYKRRQAAPGTKITPRAFGKDRRMPITNHYRPK